MEFKKIIDYTVVRSTTLPELRQLVLAEMAKGFQPFESLSTMLVHVNNANELRSSNDNYFEERIMFTQTLVRYA